MKALGVLVLAAVIGAAIMGHHVGGFITAMSEKFAERAEFADAPDRVECLADKCRKCSGDGCVIAHGPAAEQLRSLLSPPGQPIVVDMR